MTKSQVTFKKAKSTTTSSSSSGGTKSVGVSAGVFEKLTGQPTEAGKTYEVQVDTTTPRGGGSTGYRGGGGGGGGSNVAPTNPANVQQPTQTVSPNNPYNQQEPRGVEISPGLASKISQQSLRPDARYYVNPLERNKPRQSVDVQAGSPNKPKESFGQRLKRGVSETAIIGEIIPAFKYAFTPQPLPGQETTAEQVKGRESFASLLTLGGVGATAKPTVTEASRVTVGSRSTVQTITSEEAVVGTAKVKGAGAVETKNILGQTKTTPFKIVGKVKETAKPIDLEVFGLQGEDVYSTSGRGSLKVTTPKKSFLIESESKGFEVAGAGKREVTQNVLGIKGLRQTPATTTQESFITVTEGDTTRGSVVSKQGGSVFVAKKKAEVDILKPGGNKYYNPETGLESSTSTLNLKPAELVKIDYSKVNAASTSKAPLSAEYTWEASGARIRDNIKPIGDITKNDVIGGIVSPEAKGQLSLGLEQVKVNPQPGKTLNLNPQIESAVLTQYPEKRVKIPVSFPLRSGIVETQLEKTETKKTPLTTNQIYSPKTASIAEVKVIANQNAGAVLGTSPFQKIGSASRQGIGSLNVQKQPLKPATQPISSLLPAQEIKTASLQKTSQISALTQITQPKITTRAPFYTPLKLWTNPSTPLMKIPKFEREGTGVYAVDVRRFGVFKRIGEGLGLQQAIKLGASRVRGTPAATFKVSSGNRPVQITPPVGFYRKKGGLNIEKNRYRINTPGEFSGISRIGIQSLMKKRKL